MKFRKKPVIIEAEQFTEENKNRAFHFITCNKGEDTLGGKPVLRIHTLEGMMTAMLGDWIIRGVKGEFYPCKDDIFRATYEAVDAGTQAAIVANVFKLAQKLGHSPISSEHALTFLKEYIQHLQATNAELQEALDTARAERVREKSIYADECAERQMWESRAKVLEAVLESAARRINHES